MQIRLAGLGTALPPHRLEQAALYRETLAPYFSGNPRAEKIFAHPAIATRHSVLPDPAAFFQNAPGAGDRNARYAEAAPPLGQRAADACLAAAGIEAEALDAIVTVTCTGYMTPGLDILLARALGMRQDARRYALGGMGCYAAFPALNLARETLLAGSSRHALVVCVELCSLHFQAEDDTDNIVSTSLFADGASAALLSVAPGPGWRLVDTRTATLYETGQHMTWHLTDTGFRMYLSSYVPLLLKEAVGPWVSGWLGEHGLAPDAVAHWGLHPGGPRILDGLQAELKLSDEQLAASRGVLRDCGNMSSATILFVLDRLTGRAEPGDHAVLMAFGPGLTMEGALLRWEA